MEPATVILSFHAEARRAATGVTREQVVEAIRVGHGRRRRNSGSSDWRIRAGAVSVLYNWPHDGDHAVAFVVTVYREG